MVSPRTRGIRGRGTLLKKKAKRNISAGLITIICALFSIGITLDGIFLTTFFSPPFNILSIIGFVIGTTAIGAGFSFWMRGRKLQRYYKRKRNLKQKLEYRIRHKRKNKKGSKSKSQARKSGKSIKKSKKGIKKNSKKKK